MPGFPEYRVFLLDLGRDRYTKVEFLRGGIAVAEHALSDEVIRMEDCFEAAPPSRDDWERRADALEECVLRGE